MRARETGVIRKVARVVCVCLLAGGCVPLIFLSAQLLLPVTVLAEEAATLEAPGFIATDIAAEWREGGAFDNRTIGEVSISIDTNSHDGNVFIHRFTRIAGKEELMVEYVTLEITSVSEHPKDCYTFKAIQTIVGRTLGTSVGYLDVRDQQAPKFELRGEIGETIANMMEAGRRFKEKYLTYVHLGGRY